MRRPTRNDTNQLTEGAIFPTLLAFTLPILVGNLVQQLFNTTDLLIVGNFCGSAALAAVGASASIINLYIGAAQGFAIGAGVVISNHLGARNQTAMVRSVHTAVLISAMIGSTLALISFCFSRWILQLMHTPDSVLPLSIQYFRIYSVGLFFLALYNIGSGIFRAWGNTRLPLYYLIASAVLNVVLDLLFVGVFKMGVKGAALASTFSQALSAGLCFISLFSKNSLCPLQLENMKIDSNEMHLILRNALPGSFQNCIVSLSNVVVQSNVNAFGELAIAGFVTYNKLGSFAVLPAIGLSMSITTFVSQNLGAGKYDRINYGIRIGGIFAALVTGFIGGLVTITAPQAIGLFNDEAEVIRIGTMMAHRVAPFLSLLGISHVLAGALRGAGLSRAPMIILIATWCIFRMIWIYGFIHIVPDIRIIFWAYPVTWISSVLALYWYWRYRFKNCLI